MELLSVNNIVFLFCMSDVFRIDDFDLGELESVILQINRYYILA